MGKDEFQQLMFATTWTDAEETCRQVDSVWPVIRAMLADAWDQGFDAGERDVFEHEHHGDWDSECIRNPYRD